MNFAAVKQANGQNVTMFATFTEIGGVELNKNQKQFCKCRIIDDDKVSHQVRLYGSAMPAPTLLKMRQEFNLSYYTGTNPQTGQPYTGYSGFWNDRAEVNQVPANAPPAPYNAPPAPQAPQAPYNAPQTPQPAPQQPNVPQGMNMPDTYAYPVTPETARRMARTAFMTAILGNGQKPLYSFITELVEYSYTGIEPNQPAQNEPTKDLFCGGCNNLKEDCVCDPKY